MPKVEPIPVFQGDVVEFTHGHQILRGVVEASGLDADAVLDDFEDYSESKEKATVLSYPGNKIIEKNISDFKLIDRAVLPGDIVRYVGHEELGTVMSITSHAKIRILETNYLLKDICVTRLQSTVKFNEGDRVEYNGWLGSIRELEEDRIIIETEDGVINFDEDEEARIDPEFRFLSLRGFYEDIEDWRRIEEDSGIFLNQQVNGSFGVDGSLEVGKIVSIDNGDAEIVWVASGNRKLVAEPKTEWPFHELHLLRAPWCEDVNHSEVNAPSLGSRFTMDLTGDEAYDLNRQAEVENEKPIDREQTVLSFSEVKKELFGDKWTLVKVGKYECILYDGQTVSKFKNEKSYNFVDLIGKILWDDDDETDQTKKMNTLLTEFKCTSLSDVEIIRSNYVYKPKGLDVWSKQKYRCSEGDANNEQDVVNILAKLRGQGHSKHTFNTGDSVSIEIVDIKSDIVVQWQDGEKKVHLSVDLIPALHINEHDYSPGDFVVRKDESRDPNEYGCITAADNQDRLIEVLWDDGIKEKLSTFDIEEHPDYKAIRIGELVVYSKSDDIEDLENNEISGVGVVKDISMDGHLVVSWTCGKTTKIKPRNVISEHILFGDAFEDAYFGASDSLDAEDMDEDDAGDDGWVSCDSSSSEIDVKDINDQIKEKDKKPEEMRKLIVDILSGKAVTLKEENDMLTEDNQSMVASLQDMQDELNGNLSDEDSLQLKSLDFPDSTHSYLNKSNLFLKQGYLKVYQSEIRRLRSSLPKGIYFRTYEYRVDLLSYLIEGPADTPYEHCLFAFDVCLSSDYPMTPPKVTYKSMINQKINPNLYETGNVCLSLLGTWSGKMDSEEWNCNSNLLQVVVSIQGMVLTGSPYFNEAGYEKQMGTTNGELNSKNYNELVMVRLCDHVVSSIRNAPAPFKEFYHEYYFEQGHLRDLINRFQNIIEGKVPLKYALMPLSKGCSRALQSQLKILNELEVTKGQVHSSPMV